MFSGIVENIGIVQDIKKDGENLIFTLKSPISTDAYIDQSIAHNGVCLTVTSFDVDSHRVTAIYETLLKTNLQYLKVGDRVNLERSLQFNQRVDGHFVQGHVDAIALCKDILESAGSWYFHFEMDEKYSNLMVQKGSICINGVSLTLVTAEKGSFSVAIIPFTYEHTNFSNLQVGDFVNIEFDIFGKYIVKYLQNINITI
jgi:riboflavin synthase